MNNKEIREESKGRQIRRHEVSSLFKEIIWMDI